MRIDLHQRRRLHIYKQGALLSSTAPAIQLEPTILEQKEDCRISADRIGPGDGAPELHKRLRTDRT